MIDSPMPFAASTQHTPIAAIVIHKVVAKNQWRSDSKRFATMVLSTAALVIREVDEMPFVTRLSRPNVEVFRRSASIAATCSCSEGVSSRSFIFNSGDPGRPEVSAVETQQWSEFCTEILVSYDSVSCCRSIDLRFIHKASLPGITYVRQATRIPDLSSSDLRSGNDH